MKKQYRYLLNMVALCLAACAAMNDEPETEQVRTDGITTLSASRADDGYSKYPDGMPYRLLAFTQPDTVTLNAHYYPARHLRFNQVATERETGETNHKYIQVEDVNSDFGFNPTSAESEATTRSDLKLKDRTIDFYGFTNGEVEGASANYLALRDTGNIHDPNAYFYDEYIENSENTLQDLQWGRLYNQSLRTAPPHCKIPFEHCYSQLTLEVMQEEGEATETNPHPGRYNISIAKAEIAGTYDKLSIRLADKQMRRPDKATHMTRTIPNAGNVTLMEPLPTAVTRYGTILLLPSAGVLNGATADTIKEELSLRLTLSSTNSSDLAAFKKSDNTNEVQTVSDGGTTYYTLQLPPIRLVNSLEWENSSSSVNTGTKPLYLTSGRSYNIRVGIYGDAVYIMSFIPKMVSWVMGETTANGSGSPYDYQLQAAGTPQQFGGNIWMDRNLGATGWDPATDFQSTVGYFYQQFRNIPYWPFRTANYALSGKTLPYKRYRYAANNQLEFNRWNVDASRMYPILTDAQITKNAWWSGAATYANDLVDQETFNTWESPTAANRQNFNFRTRDYTPIDWAQVANQPVPSGGWRIPSVFDFLRIFPAQAYAGNYAFRKVLNPTDGNSVTGLYSTIFADTTKYLRVCVPYYIKDMNNPNNAYTSAWRVWSGFNNPKDPGYMVGGNSLTESDAKGYNNNNKPNAFYSHPKELSSNQVDFLSDPGLPGATIANQVPTGKTPYVSVYLIVRANDKWNSGETFNGETYGTIYGIKCYRTPEAYAMRWKWRRVNNPQLEQNAFYLEVNYYRLNNPRTTILTKDTYLDLIDWNRPSSTMYFPMSGMGEINFNKYNVMNNTDFYHYGYEVTYHSSTISDATDYKGYVVRMKAPIKDNNEVITILKDSKKDYAGQLRLVKD